MVTAILLSYKRQPNVRRIIPVLREQSVEPHIVLVNNGDSYVTECAEQEPDELFQMPRGIGPFARWLVAYAYVGWLYFQDDDLIPKDTMFLEDLLALAKKRPKVITGVYGRHIPPDPPHYIHKDTDGPTNMVKGMCTMVHRSTVGRMRFPPKPVGRCEDIWVSLETSQGDPIHFTDLLLARRLEWLPEWDTGLSSELDHFPEREAFSAAWWREKLLKGD